MSERIGRIKLMRPHWAGATATASSSPDTAAHLLNLWRDHVWYSDAAPPDQSLPDQTITLSWPEPVAIDTLVLDRHNLSGTAKVRWQLYRSGAEVYDSGFLSVGHPIPWGVFKAGVNFLGECWDDQLNTRVAEHYLPLLQFADQLIVTISDPDNAAGQARIERLPVGQSDSLINNFSWGAVLVWVDKTQHFGTVGGGLDIQRGEVYRELSVSFEWLEGADRAWLHAQLARSKAEVWFVSAYPTARSGGIESLAHMFTGVRTTDVKTSRSNSRFGKTPGPIIFREA